MLQATTQSQPYVSNRVNQDYDIQKFRFPNNQAEDFSILYTANSESTYMGCACMHGTREQVSLKITVPNVFRGWGIEAHLLFHIREAIREEAIQDIVVSDAHDEELLDTLQAMGFIVSSNIPD